MGFGEIARDIAERHDAWERNMWSKIPLIIRVIVSPIFIIPYVVFEGVTYLVFLLPYTMMENMLSKHNNSGE